MSSSHDGKLRAVIWGSLPCIWSTLRSGVKNLTVLLPEQCPPRPVNLLPRRLYTLFSFLFCSAAVNDAASVPLCTMGGGIAFQVGAHDADGARMRVVNEMLAGVKGACEACVRQEKEERDGILANIQQAKVRALFAPLPP